MNYLIDSSHIRGMPQLLCRRSQSCFWLITDILTRLMINDMLPGNILGSELSIEPSQFSFTPRELEILDFQTKVVFASSNSLLDISK